MSYGLIYTIPFKSRLNNSFQVNIEKDDYTGASTELQGAGSEAFTVDIDEPDNDFRYTPTIGSTAKIKIIGSDYLQSLYSDNYQEYRVTLLENGNPVWMGFIKPENYTQDYVNDLFELDIDCLSGINVLQYIKYTQQGVDERIFVSLWNLTKLIVNELKLNYNAIYIPHVYADSAADYTTYDNVLAKMEVSEANFFDDLNSTTTIINEEGDSEVISDENPWKLQDLLENICRLLHWTCVDWDGSLYFVDPDWSGEYLEYTADLSSFIIIEKYSVGNELGFAGSDHTLDILPGYNKVTVKTSNYNAGDVFPTESFDDLTELETDDYSNGSNRCRKIFLQPKNWNPSLYNGFTDPNRVKLTNWINITDRNSKPGAQLIKRANYAVDKNGNPVEKGTSTSYTNYSYEDLIQVRFYTGTVTHFVFNEKRPIFGFTGKLPCVIYADGAISINMSVQLSSANLSNDILAFGDKISADAFGNYPVIYLTFILQIGNYYWDGTSWTTTSSTFSVATYNDSTNGYIYNGDFVAIKGNKTLSMPYNGMDGYIIPLPDTPISGELKFKMIDVLFEGDYAYSTDKFNLFIKDLKLSYQLKDTYNVDSDTDRVYENLTSACEVDRLDLSAGVSTAGNITIGLGGANFTTTVTTAYSTAILLAAFLATQTFDGWTVNYISGNNYLTFTNKEYGTCATPTIDFGSTGAAGAMSVALAGFGTYFANELDEIEEKISSYNYDGLCYSKILLNDAYLTDNLYSAIDSGTIRPEEKLIKRIANYYSAVKIKLTQVLKKDDSITPLSTFTDSYMSGKTFSMFCGNIDFQNDSFSIIMLEQ